MKFLTVLLALWTLGWTPAILNGSPVGSTFFLVSLVVTVACGLKAWPRERGPRQTWPYQ